MTSTRPRPLGAWSLLALGLNGVIGVGIFFTPGLIAGLAPGMGGVWVFVVTAAVLAPVGAVYARLGARFDADGGPYVWARAAFGGPAAFAIDWIAYVSAVLSTAAVIAGLGHALAGALGLAAPWQERLIALASGGLLVALAATGLRPSAHIWNALTVAKILPLVLLVVGFLWWRGPRLPELVAPALAGGWGRAALLAVFALQGFEIVPVPRGHARGGRWMIAFGTIGSLLLAAALYAALQAVCVRAVPELAGRGTPLVAAGWALGGATLGQVVALGTHVSAAGIAFGMAAMTPRYLVAVGSELGPVLGPWLQTESAAQVPVRALVVTAVAVVLLVSGRALAGLFVLSGLAVLAQYAASALALAKLAWTRAHGLRRRDAVWALLSTAAVALMARGAQPGELAILGGVLGAGVAVWLAFRGAGPARSP